MRTVEGDRRANNCSPLPWERKRERGDLDQWGRKRVWLTRDFSPCYTTKWQQIRDATRGILIMNFTHTFRSKETQQGSVCDCRLGLEREGGKFMWKIDGPPLIKWMARKRKGGRANWDGNLVSGGKTKRRQTQLDSFLEKLRKFSC